MNSRLGKAYVAAEFFDSPRPDSSGAPKRSDSDLLVRSHFVHSAALSVGGSSSLPDSHHHGSGPSALENVPVGPSEPSSARRTGSRAPSSTVCVPV